MGRLPRIEYQNGIYHVIQRGNNQEFIFSNEKDKAYLLKILKELKAVMNYRIFGYTLMDNHYHLILQTTSTPLQKIMQRLNYRYSRYHNKVYNRTGHSFNGRYKAIPVLDDRYLLSLVRYIHQNPVRAGMTKKVYDFFWSSDEEYRTNDESSVDIGFVLDMLSVNRNTAIKKYAKFMAVKEKEDFKRNKVIGTAAKKKTNIQEGLSNRQSLDEILREIITCPVEYQEITNGSRRRRLTKYKLQYIQKALDACYTLEETGKPICLSDSAVLKLLQRNKSISQVPGTV